MAQVTYNPTPEEVMGALKEQVDKSEFMMLVAVTDPEDPGWRGGDHINFSLNNTPKGWILEGSNGYKYKLSIKQVEPKLVKPEPAYPDIEPPPNPPQVTVPPIA